MTRVFILALMIITTPASAMTKSQALELCSREALNALPPPVSVFYVENDAQLAGARIGDALGRAVVLLSVRSACMHRLGFGKKARRPVRER